MTNPRRATLTLLVSLPGTGQEELSIQIPMTRVASLSKGIQGSDSQQTHLLDTGLNQKTSSHLTEQIRRIDLSVIEEEALSTGYGESPVRYALALLMSLVIGKVEEVLDDTEPGQNF